MGVDMTSNSKNAIYLYTGVVKIKAQKYRGCVNDDPLIEEA